MRLTKAIVRFVIVTLVLMLAQDAGSLASRNGAAKSLGAIATGASPSDGWTVHHLPDGVLWKQRQYSGNPYGNQSVNVLDIDTAQKGVRITAVECAGGKREHTSQMGERSNAIAGVNGGYFYMPNNTNCTSTKCTPVSLLQICGKLLYSNASQPR